MLPDSDRLVASTCSLCYLSYTATAEQARDEWGMCETCRRRERRAKERKRHD